MKTSWFEIYKQPVKLFLNMICYVIDKGNEEKNQIENWKRRH